MEWNVTAEGDYGVRLVLSTGVGEIRPLTVKNTTFMFTRESREPLNVTLFAVNVTMDFRIFCIENIKSNSLSDALFTNVYLVASELDVSSKLILMQSILEWISLIHACDY